MSRLGSSSGSAPGPGSTPGSLAPTGHGPAFVLASLAGLCGLLGLVLPWFDPQLSQPVNGIQNLNSAYHSWSGYRVLALGPLLLITVAVMWILAGQGTFVGGLRASVNPARSLARLAVAAGAAAILAGLLSFVVMKYHYVDWDPAARAAAAAGSHLDQNPQLGLGLVLLGGVLLIAAGGLSLATGNARARTPTGDVRGR